MNKIECESCIKRKTIYCPNSEKCFATKDKPFYQDRIMLLEETQELKNQQKEFIKYLENKISELNEITKNEEDEETIHYALVRITAINELIHEINKIRKEINNDD